MRKRPAILHSNAAKLLAAWCFAAISPRAAWAQQAEQITVTAPIKDSTTAGTVDLDASSIARSGTASIGTLLDQMPAFGSQGMNAAATDSAFGEYFVDLRNLNFNRTLTMVDGSRFVLSGIQTDEAVDLNDFPTAFIDHIEVLTDGTQPQYGPDAVAGALNVALKNRVEGVRLETYGAATAVPDAGTGEISLIGGHAFTDGHVTFGFDVYHRDPVRQRDRDWAADPIVSATTQSTPAITYGSPATTGGHAVGATVNSVIAADGRAAPYDAASDDYNTGQARDLEGGLERETAYFNGDLALGGDITSHAELLYTQRRSTITQPPAILGLTGTEKNPGGFTIPAADTSNPFGTEVTLERVVGEAGAQNITTSGPVWRVTMGLEGMLGDWGWSASFDQGQSLSRYVADNQVDLTRALATAGNGICLAASGCVEADWFGAGRLSAQALRYVTYTSHSQSAYSETIGLGRLSGPLFRAPGGTARLTLGLEARREAGSTSVDPVTAAGDQAGNDAAATRGSYATAEAYATLSLPLLKDILAVKRLDLSAALRETTTSRYGSFATFRGALSYEPMQGVTLRAVSGVARRPPAIAEAFGGITGTQQPVTDPCDAVSGLRANPIVAANCRSQGLGSAFAQASPSITVESGGNPHVHPENSENEMLGVTLQPPSMHWLTASVDYYHYRVKNAIDSRADTNAELIPDLCYESPHLSSPQCRLITRIAGGGNAGQISSILALDENVGTIKEQGLDLELKGAVSLSDETRLTLDWQTNWLLDYRLGTQGVSGFTQYAGTFPGLNDVGGYSRLRSRASADLTYGNWSFDWTGRYISGGSVLGDDASDLYDSAPAVFYQDVDISRRMGRVTVMAGIDNLTGLKPPTLIDGETNTDTNTYDVVGRYVWARLIYDF